MEPLRSPVWLLVALVFALAEMCWRLGARRGYDGRAALTTLGLVVGSIPFALLQGTALALVFGWLADMAPAQFAVDAWTTWVLGFFAVEFAYYWFHRASHRVGWLWATHSVHHSAEQLTLLSSFRLGWTNLFSAGWIFYAPLVLLGFPPLVVAALLAFNLRYQFFLHTEAVGKLGPVEWVFNTPAHHRLHHGANPAYIDRNYGGVLILFDRLFGTLATEVEGEPIRYGLAHRAPTRNPVTVALREWILLFRRAWAAGSPAGTLRVLFAPPAP